MEIDDIRKEIAQKLSSDEYSSWVSLLDDSSPGHYGVEDLDVDIDYSDIFVDIPNRTFTFKNVGFSFTLQIGSSNNRDGYVDKFNRVVSGNGGFSLKEQSYSERTYFKIINKKIS